MENVTAGTDLHPLIAGRWSARGYDAAATIGLDEVTTVLEAGRWAATWGRVQPVRFVVGLRGDETFGKLTATLNRGNQGWAGAAAALILLSTSNSDDEPDLHQYGAVDLGLALGQMSIQAQALGFNPHPMAGFNHEAARETFGIPAEQRPMVILALGRLTDDPASLAPEIAERDAWPRTRLPLSEIAYAGSWGDPFIG